MNFLIGAFFISISVFFASLPFVAFFFALNAIVFDTANFFRRRRKLPPRPKPWVFQTKKDANIAWVIAFLAMLAFNDWSKLSLQFLAEMVRRWFA